MKIPYYPGCTLSTQGKGFDHSARKAAEALDMPLQEIPDWQCCGATFPLATDNALAMVAPAELLNKAVEAGGHMTTLCAVCFHVLRRSRHFLRQHPEMAERIAWFIGRPCPDGTRISHFLELLRDDIGWESLAARLSKPLHGLKAAPYYGCLLLRPHEEIQLDNPDAPRILHDFLEAIGCEVVDFPFHDECCGSFLKATKPELAEAMADKVVQSALALGADCIVTACPLCQFNLDHPQKAAVGTRHGKTLPILYFSQLLAVSLGLPPEDWGMDGHCADPFPLFGPKETVQA